jgi:hypothetical protein
MSTDGSNDRVLVVAMPLRHLESARSMCERSGTATLPAGGPGDLDETPAGTTVLAIATEAGDATVPAATWRAVFVRREPHDRGDPWPAGSPETWVEEHPELDVEAPGGDSVVMSDEDEEDDRDDEDEGVGPQSFFRVRELAPSPPGAWVHTNELVPKQQRGGRTFLPRTPRLVWFID